jgi:hypothetical protein
MDRLNAKLKVGEKRCSAFWMPRCDPNGSSPVPLLHSLADAICRFRRKLTKVDSNCWETAGCATAHRSSYHDVIEFYCYVS